MTYQVNLKRKAISALVKLDEPYYSNIKNAIYNLAQNPRPQGYKKLRYRRGYRIRVGNYRIIYNIFDNLLVVEVIDLGHRREIYG